MFIHVSHAVVIKAYSGIERVEKGGKEYRKIVGDIWSATHCFPRIEHCLSEARVQAGDVKFSPMKLPALIEVKVNNDCTARFVNIGFRHHGKISVAVAVVMPTNLVDSFCDLGPTENFARTDRYQFS